MSISNNTAAEQKDKAQNLRSMSLAIAVLRMVIASIIELLLVMCTNWECVGESALTS
jgi:hypothetical protein